MSNTTEAPTNAEKVRTLLTHNCLAHIDSNLLHELLTRGDPQSGVEPLPESKQGFIDRWRANDWSDDNTVSVWSNHEEIIDRLELLALHAADERISQATEADHSVGTYLRGVDNAVQFLPKWLRPRLIESELYRLDAGTYDTPSDWQRLIGLLQIEHEGDYYPEGRDAADNNDDRRNAWDELLKFTKYRVKVTYTIGDGGVTSLTAEDWAQRESEIHNRAVRLIPDDGEFEGAEATALERFEPGDVQDPLIDMESFVYYDQ